MPTAYSVLDTVLNALHILTQDVQHIYKRHSIIIPSFTDEETEEQKGKMPTFLVWATHRDFLARSPSWRRGQKE